MSEQHDRLKVEWDLLWNETPWLHEPPGAWDALVAAYSELHRAYHTLEHLDSCFQTGRALLPPVAMTQQVRFALFYHDIVYDPKARGGENEKASARVATDILTAAVAYPSLIHGVGQIILATATHLAANEDAQVMLDIDLAILGSDPETFARYEAAIRHEYSFVPERIYRSKRKEVLEGFLERERLFVTDEMHDALDAQARKNLFHSIQALAPRKWFERSNPRP